MILALLEVNKLVANAFRDEDTASMLLNNRFLVLKKLISSRRTIVIIGKAGRTLKIASSTFSLSPGFPVPAGRARSSCSFRSLASIRRSSCGMLFRAYRSLRSNISRTLTRQSRWRLRSSRTPSVHPRASSSSRLWLVERCRAVAVMPSLRDGMSLVSTA